MWSFSTIPRYRLVALLCLLPVAMPAHPGHADGIYGKVLAPQKRSQKTAGSLLAPTTKQILVPLPQQQVDICTLDGKQCQSQTTDSEGYFEFDKLKQGTYRLKTLGSNGRVLDNEIKIDPGQTKQLSVIAK